MLTIVAVRQNNVLKLPKIFLFLHLENCFLSHTCLHVSQLLSVSLTREELIFSSHLSIFLQEDTNFSQFWKLYFIEKWFLIDICIYVSSLVPQTHHLILWYHILYLNAAVMLYLLCKKLLWFTIRYSKAFKITILAFLERDIHFSTGANFWKKNLKAAWFWLKFNLMWKL